MCIRCNYQTLDSTGWSKPCEIAGKLAYIHFTKPIVSVKEGFENLFDPPPASEKIVNLTNMQVKIGKKLIKPGKKRAYREVTTTSFLHIEDLPTVQRVEGEIKNLPDPDGHTFYLISYELFRQLPLRDDILSVGYPMHSDKHNNHITCDMLIRH